MFGEFNLVMSFFFFLDFTFDDAGSLLKGSDMPSLVGIIVLLLSGSNYEVCETSYILEQRRN